MITVEKSFAEKHYADLSSKPFFPSLVDYIVSGPVVAMVWEGKNVVLVGRSIIGATNPAAAAPGTIRGDYAVEIGRSVLLIPAMLGISKKKKKKLLKSCQVSWLAICSRASSENFHRQSSSSSSKPQVKKACNELSYHSLCLRMYIYVYALECRVQSPEYS